MLAIADLATALAVAGSLALFPGGTLVDALWAAVFAPRLDLLAKLPASTTATSARCGT